MNGSSIAAAELFRRQGYAGTGREGDPRRQRRARTARSTTSSPAARRSSASRCSHAGGAVYRELVEAFFVPGGDVVRATRDFFEGAAEMIEETDYADACPIATVALEMASTSEPMRRAAADGVRVVARGAQPTG